MKIIRYNRAVLTRFVPALCLLLLALGTLSVGRQDSVHAAVVPPGPSPLVTQTPLVLRADLVLQTFDKSFSTKGLKVVNQGQVSTRSFTVLVYVDGMLTQTVAVAGLAAGQSSVIPGVHIPAVGCYQVIADSANVIYESNEQNNVWQDCPI